MSVIWAGKASKGVMVACSMKGDFRGDPTRLVRPSDNMRLLETQLGHCLQF